MKDVNPLDVVCPVCGVLAGEQCVSVDPTVSGPRFMPHGIRVLSAKDAAVTAERRRNEEDEVAERIAAWVLSPSGKRDLGLQDADVVHRERYANAIRAGKWRT